MFKTLKLKPVIQIQHEQKGFGHWNFGHLVLFRISDFDIRILDLLSTPITAVLFRGLPHAVGL